MHDAMVSWGFKRLLSKHCFYYCRLDESTVMAVIHVDDFLITGSNLNALLYFKGQLTEKWKISDLGEAKFCIGISIEQDYNLGIVKLSQSAFIDWIVILFGQEEAYPQTTPMEEGFVLQRPTSNQLITAEEERLPYWSLIGMLMYIAIGTRPDTSYTVSKLSCFLDCYCHAYWKAAIHVVRYLKGTCDMKLTLEG